MKSFYEVLAVLAVLGFLFFSIFIITGSIGASLMFWVNFLGG